MNFDDRGMFPTAPTQRFGTRIQMLLQRTVLLLLAGLVTAGAAAAQLPQPADSTEEVPVYTGIFEGVAGHEAGGSYVILRRGNSWVVRMNEDFTSEKVPDGWVALSDWPEALDSKAQKFSKLLQRQGQHEYLLPEGIDPGDFKYLLVWCQRFTVGVAQGRLQPVD